MKLGYKVRECEAKRGCWVGTVVMSNVDGGEGSKEGVSGA